MDPGAADADLDLVALATVADCVPLVDENRRLVREGLRALASTRKPGLQALMQVARVDPSGVDAGAIGFRLAPRINAAGRLHRADAGLELLLTADVERARAIAEELDRVNVERRDVETRILFEAEAQVAAARAGGAEPAAYVLAADGWHPGVIGIVASRIAERHHRPGGADRARRRRRARARAARSPRSTCSAGSTRARRDLLRHGGHRAAAGLTIARERVDAFRAAFAAHAAAMLTPEDLSRGRRVDAVVPGDALQLGLAEELERLAPFGMANPEPSLLVPSALLADPRPMGEGRHVSFTLAAGGARSRCVVVRPRQRAAGRPGRAGRRRGPARGQPLQRRGRAAARPAPRAAGAAGADRAGRRAGARRALRTSSDAELGGADRHARRGRDDRARRADGLRPARGSATRAAAASPGCSATSSPPASRCSPSPPTPGTARGRARRPRRRLRAHDLGGARGRPGARGAVRARRRGRPAAHAHLRALAEAAARRRLDPPRLGRRGARARAPRARLGARPAPAARRPLPRAPRRPAARRATRSCATLRGTAPQPRSGALIGRLLRVLAELELVARDAGAARRSTVPAPAGRTELERSPAFRAYAAPARRRPRLPGGRTGRHPAGGGGLRSRQRTRT